MAVIGSIKEFNVNEPSQWENYAEQLKFFLEANEITDAAKKRATLLAVIGGRTLSIVRSLIAPATPSDKTFDELIAVLQRHFYPKPSEIYRRFRFQKRMQNSNEDISAYVLELRRMADDCNFGATLSERLRDQLVVGLKDEALQRRLLSETTLTFDDAVSKAIASEIAEKQTKSIHSKTDSNNETFSVYKQGVQNNYSKFKANDSDHKCYGCGGSHNREQCRFKNVNCRQCGKRGHIQKVCRSKGKQNFDPKTTKQPFKQKGKTAHFIESETVENSACMQLKTLSNNSDNSRLQTTVLINNFPCIMEVDSGAKVSIIDNSTFRNLFPNNLPILMKSPYEIKDYNRNSVKILGQCNVPVQYASFQGELPLLIAKEQRESILGVNWFQPLGISLTGIHTINMSTLTDLVNEFHEVFNQDLGTFKGTPISLNLDPSIQPIRLKARTVPFALKPKIEKELQRLIELKILEPVDSSDWMTPVVPILKPNGEIRLCGDYKCTINKALKLHPYPIPAVNQVLSQLAGSRYFIKLDLSRAYLQLTVDDASAKAQTIVTHKGAFKCNRLQFGVSSAPGIFQQFIDKLLSKIPGVIPYFDDVLIKGSTLEELQERFREVLKLFSKSGLKLNKDKCIIGASKIEYLGFLIDKNGISPTKDKVKAIHNAPVPKSKEELQAFLGLLNFYHSFLPNKANVAEPLHRLLDKGAPWRWTKHHDEAFDHAKKLLSSETLLTHFDEKKPLILTCDASQYGVGAVLSHELEEGVEAPIAYYSRTMNSTERRYAQIDKEALAIIQGVKKFHNYVYGHKFEIRTDHKPLLGLLAPNKPIPNMLSPRMQRWSIMLSSYDFDLVYKPGKTIANADGLSRLPQPVIPKEEDALMEVLLLEALKKPLVRAEYIAKITAHDPILSRVLNWVWRGWPQEMPSKEFEPFFSRKQELSAHKGCLLWGSRVVIPRKLQTDMLDVLHSTHEGIVRTKALARSYVWWPYLDKDIENLINKCNLCQQTRNSPPKCNLSWEKAKEPWSRLHIDHAGPFQGSIFLIIVDSFSKWLEVVKVPSTDASSTINSLRKLFSTFGVPDVIVSDNGPGFTSEEFQDFLERNGIRHVPTAPKHPSSNGQAERMVQTTKNALKRIIKGNWSYRLSSFLIAQHTIPSSSTGVSPAELLMNRKLKTCLDKLHPDLCESSVSKKDSKHSKFRMYAPLDTVYALGFPPHEKWVPATIIEVLGAVNYYVRTNDGLIWKRHVDQLRPQHTGSSSAIQESSKILDETDYTNYKSPDHVRLKESENPVNQVPENLCIPIPIDDCAQVEESPPSTPVPKSPNFHVPTREPIEEPPPKSRPIRDRRPPVWLKDYKT